MIIRHVVIDIPSAGILHKILTKDPTIRFGPLLPLLGEYTSSGVKALKLMLEIRFPGSVEIQEEDIALGPLSGLISPGSREWALAGLLVSHNRIRWMVLGFNACKSLEKDGILLAVVILFGAITLAFKIFIGRQ
jgi:hypothetical protein